MSHFLNGGYFCWVADAPYHASDIHYARFVPREVVGGYVGERKTSLFVRKAGADRYLYVGELGPSHRFSHGGHGAADLPLTPALPSAVWVGLGGLQLGDLDHASIDAALDRLRPPVNAEERFWVLRRLVEYWHGPIGPEDGFGGQELEGLAMPHPLWRWYRWAGRRRSPMRGQNFLLDPDRLRIEDGKLLFYVENQGCYRWGTDVEGDDPPVFGRRETSDPWDPEGITLSEHLILACLFEAIMCHSPYGASASWLEVSVLDRIAEHIPPIAIGPWRWPETMSFYAKGGAFMFAGPNGEIDGKRGYSVWIGAKIEHPLGFLKPLIDNGWEYVAV
jgi:hypothetical protein